MATIFALSSGMPPSAIAIVRISGPDAVSIVGRVARGSVPVRRPVLRTLRHPETHEPLDKALVLRFDGPDSATGEDLVELHLHGGRAVVRAVQDALALDPRARPAEPGEFTRQALCNGRIDLTQAEGLADLLAAATASQRRAAMFASEGGTRRAIDALVGDLLMLSARAEAAIDFEEEDDVAVASVDRLRQDIVAFGVQLTALIAQPTVDRLRDGFRVVLAGPPNSGKSTLINRLADREVAIVTDIAGTTRDRIEVAIVHAGKPYILTDTAGLTDTDDPVEQIGVTLAYDAIEVADILLWLGDDSPPVTTIPTILLHARSDARPGASEDRLAVSAMTGWGIAELWARIDGFADGLIPPVDSLALNRRQHDLMCDAKGAIDRATVEDDLLLVAESMREARVAFDRITGRADVEAMLDHLFGRFCIGK